LEELLEDAIRRQAIKLLRRSYSDAAHIKRYRERFEKRTGEKAISKIKPTPGHWSISKHFEPRYCLSHSKYLARIIWKKIIAGEYIPKPAVKYAIPKDSGGSRDIMIFTIPDAAVATLFHNRITNRNLNLLSANCFSYRPDRNIFDAIIQIRSAIACHKVYVVQYDFSKYFDSIDHHYIKAMISNKDIFLLTKAERYVVSKFLTHEYASKENYTAGQFSKRDRGVPQGCSLSLILSNVAAHELDKALETSNGQFVRFADDVLAMVYSYDDALHITDIFNEHCKRSGITINHEKSHGIKRLDGATGIPVRSFFINMGEGDKIEAIKDFDYLGHKFQHDETLLSTRSIKKIKRRLSKAIYIHLLLSPRSKELFSSQRIGAPFHDWDLVTCLNELRRYIYGELHESQIENFLERDKRLPKMRGLMSFYPLVSSLEQLRELDGWLMNILQRALREREKALGGLGHSYTRPSKAEVFSGSWYKETTVKNETKLPSFVRAWRAARKYYFRYGLKDIKPPSYYSLLSTY